ncbi:3-oxoacyl-[acyl-carrier-protein] reductase [Treponema sp. OMZ 792]|uniref:3-oxoacyl-[acyl-carrier-protein] reductase n=1 Tax=unclassified Treponema TaxID=2638727 RepID=UPI0020A24814|nr:MULTISPECIES: 3-oxoacyl-[acyl-carrier-protein] reductase [unclassified Treponema]UTC76457.1 3-oxoacyl-[acyl-carrier-protein] reductase [Treponema sp. OMZ 792]UTC81642.1 3-oxoacyl-[acyl-carrier-protein] reductase [Treponema sp. OMZ 798]
MLLQGKKALVTGSSRGIGKEVVRRFIEEGAEVWGLCTKPSAAKSEMEAFAKEKGSVFHEIYADCGNAEGLTETVKKALEESGGFDVLVNNAGITRDGLSFRMKLSDWEDVLRVNLTGVFIASQIVSSDMIRKRAGSIINMTSIVGLHGQGGQVNYSASKAGLIGFTKSLAKETAGRGVRVNAIAPGYIETDMTAAVNEEMRKTWVEGIPLKRAGQPIDIANAAVFLASDLSLYITAQVLGVDGGLGA